MRILVVEDEPSLGAVLWQALTEAGYGVDVARSCKEAVSAIESADRDFLVLDLMLPDGNGLEILSRFRAKSQAPVLILSARSGLGDRIHGLDDGADDYMVKPFRLEELLARIRALTRRSSHRMSGTGRDTLAVADLKIDFAFRRVSRDGRLIFLSTTEYALLEFLAQTPGQVVRKSAILRHVWDDDQRGPNVVEVYVNYLRHKLERNGAPRLIHTVRGHGYVLSESGIG